MNKNHYWSNSSLNEILNNPISYYLSHKQHIKRKETKPALNIGSMFHWLLENGTEDLTQYLCETKNEFNNVDEQVMATGMAHLYFLCKDRIFKELLGEAKLIDEQRELELHIKEDSLNIKDFKHEFVGIIDLLLLTDKGFIIVDYKTSVQKPDIEKYQEQVIRYYILLNQLFPDVPVYKVGIINVRKCSIRRKVNESDVSFRKRINGEYNVDDGEYLDLFVYTEDEINKEVVKDYETNLKKELDMAYNIESNNNWFINYGALQTQYGKSDYYEICKGIKDCQYLYKINDYIFDEDEDNFITERDCNEEDMLVIKKENIINHYNDFKELYEDSKMNEKKFIDFIKSKFIINDDLMKIYFKTYKEEEKIRKLIDL